MAVEIRYRWRYYDEVRRRHVVTSFHCTEDLIHKEYPDAQPVEGTREELTIVENWRVNSTSHFQYPPPMDNDAMCGRYALFGPQSRYREHFAAEDWPDFPDRYNIAPSLSVPVIRQSPEGKRVVDLLRWGLIPNWAKDPSIGTKLNNARGESVADKPSFRSAYKRRRCIVPASGFYEWQQVAGKKWKQPWFIRMKGGQPMAMAGLWESWRDPTDHIIRTFCVITTGPNEVMAPIHDRMPVMIQPTDFARWLSPEIDGSTLASLLAPLPAELIEAYPVSRKVSRAREDGLALVEPAAI